MTIIKKNNEERVVCQRPGRANARSRVITAARLTEDLELDRREFSSITHAAQILGAEEHKVTSTSICTVLSGKCKQSGGWVFRYKDTMKDAE